jgi:tetratricopeptide (TPR) repeat protein
VSSEDVAGGALMHGRGLLEVGRPEEAAARFREAIAAEPEWLEPRCQLALALLRAGRSAEALEAADGAVALDPEEEWPHRLRAIALKGLGKKREAVSAAELCVAFEPENALAHQVLGDVRLAAGDSRGAREAATTARELQPDTPGPHVLLGDIALDQDRFPEADQHYRAALALDAENTQALNNLGVALLGQRRNDEARDVFERVARLDPRADTARQNLATTSRGYVNGVALFIVAYLAFRAILEAIRDGNPGVAIIVGAAAAAALGFVLWQRSRRMATLSPGARQLLADQKWHEKIELRRWRPLWWLIPSPIWFVGGVLGLIAFAVAGATGSASHWGPGDYVVIACLAALTAVFGYYARRRLLRRGSWPFR